MSVDVEGVKIVAQPCARSFDGDLVERHALVTRSAGSAAGQVDLDRRQYLAAPEGRRRVPAA